jgi:hypothetical protein
VHFNACRHGEAGGRFGLLDTGLTTNGQLYVGSGMRALEPLEMLDVYAFAAVTIVKNLESMLSGPQFCYDCKMPSKLYLCLLGSVLPKTLYSLPSTCVICVLEVSIQICQEKCCPTVNLKNSYISLL